MKWLQSSYILKKKPQQKIHLFHSSYTNMNNISIRTNTLPINPKLFFRLFRYNEGLFQRNFTRNFLRGSAARRTTTTWATPASTTSPKAVTRTTKPPRRKYLTRFSTTTKKSLESQGTTTSKPTSVRFEFASRRPPFLRRTAATPTYEKLKSAENDSVAKPLELRDVVVALKDIQSAPPPIKTTTTRYSPAEETTINVDEITFTTSRPQNRFRIKASTTTSSPTIYSSLKTHSSPNQPAHTIAYTTPFDNIFRSTLTNPYYEYSIQDNPSLGYGASHTDLLDRLPEHSKVLVHGNGLIECLDQGSFPHPIFCKKFISCAKMENGKMVGWEYTCPKNLSFDPIGGMCNWSADLGCEEL